RAHERGPRGRRRRGRGAARAERRRQDDPPAHAGAPARAHGRPPPPLRHRRDARAGRAAPPDRLRGARDLVLPGPERGGEPGLLRGAVRRQRSGGAYRPAPHLGGPRRRGPPAGPRLLAGHGPAPGARPRPPPRTGPAPPGRALQRPRPRGRRTAAAATPRAACGRPLDPARHARRRKGGADRVPPGDPPPRPHRLGARRSGCRRGGDRRGVPRRRCGAGLTMRDALAILAKDLRIEWRTREGISSVFVLGVLLLVVLTVAQDPSPETAPTLAPGVLWAAFVLTGLLAVQRGCLLGNVGFASLATLFGALATRVRAREVMLPLLLLPLLVPLLIGAVEATRAVLVGGLAGASGGLGVLAAFDVIFAVAGWLLFAYVVRD